MNGRLPPKPRVDHATHMEVLRAHRDKRHATAKFYWADICGVCWLQTYCGELVE